MRFYTGFPSHPLSDFVHSYWSLESLSGEDGDRSELVVPNGTTQLIVHFGVPFFTMGRDGRQAQPRRILCGPETHWSRVTAPSGAGMFGVVFKPSGLAPFISIPVAELASSQVALSDIMGSEVSGLQEALNQGHDFSMRVRIMDDFLRYRFSIPCRYSWGTVREAARRIAASPSRSEPGQLAFDLGLSLRSLERLFQSYIGLSPKFYQRVCRFQTAMRLLTEAGACDLAVLAQGCGFYDQSHLCHEIRRFSGMSPMDLKNYGAGAFE